MLIIQHHPEWNVTTLCLKQASVRLPHRSVYGRFLPRLSWTAKHLGRREECDNCCPIVSCTEKPKYFAGPALTPQSGRVPYLLMRKRQENTLARIFFLMLLRNCTCIYGPAYRHKVCSSMNLAGLDRPSV